MHTEGTQSYEKPAKCQLHRPYFNPLTGQNNFISLLSFSLPPPSLLLFRHTHGVVTGFIRDP